MPQLVLVVEGQDDAAVVNHLLYRHRERLPISPPGESRPDAILLEDGQGVERLLGSLRSRLKIQAGGDSPTRLGVVVDADNLARRWQSILHRIETIDFEGSITYRGHIPLNPDPEGTIIAVQGLPLLGFWLMPDNQTNGEVEDFARLLVPQTDRLWLRADQAVLDIPVEDRLFPEHDLMKAKMHTWLAWQREPGNPMGKAIRKHFLDHNAPVAQVFVRWVERLFTMEHDPIGDIVDS
ncbi:MAG: hypothetical protein OHK0022_39310 [Roseiflexaceae bacterium]